MMPLDQTKIDKNTILGCAVYPAYDAGSEEFYRERATFTIENLDEPYCTALEIGLAAMEAKKPDAGSVCLRIWDKMQCCDWLRQDIEMKAIIDVVLREAYAAGLAAGRATRLKEKQGDQ